MDALFIGGSTEWKLGPAREALVAEAQASAASGSTWAESTPLAGSATRPRSVATPSTARWVRWRRTNLTRGLRDVAMPTQLRFK